MDRQKHRVPGQVAAMFGAVTLFFSLASQAALIDSYSHSYDSGNVIIDLNVYDDQPGGSYLWEYSVTNNGYDPNPGVSNGFSGFELYLPTPIPEISNIVPNSSSFPAWNINCCSGHEVEWDIGETGELGIMPGESGTFSFLTDPRDIAINNDGWFHTWEDGAQTNIVFTTGMHVPWVPGLSNRVPEPETVMLFLIGFVALTWVARRPRAASLSAA